jgi:Tol biopolymer transport system component
MKKIIFLSLLALIISACLPQNVQVPQSPLLSKLERKSGLIAYIGADGNMYLSDQGGVKVTKLTDDAVISATNSQSGELNIYQFPTWSSDGNQLAFVGTNGTSTAATSTLYIANIKTAKTNKIYSSTTEFPVYLYWSPDNTNVSFISTSVSGQDLILQSVPAKGGKPTVIDTGSPYYWSWAPNGHTLISHAGGSSTSGVPDHMAFIQLQDSGIVEDGLDATPASFQAPAWSPDGSHILLTRVEDGKNEIILTDGAGTYLKTIGNFKLNTALGWSNDGKNIAFIDGAQAMNAGALGILNVVNMETNKKVSVADNVIAFYWSPNSEKLAYYIPFLASASSNSSNNSGSTAQQVILQLNMYDVKTGESRKLFTYQPTDEFKNTLPYFDQYQQSNTIWSPDNNNLVLSFVDQNGKSGIAVVAASGQLQPRLLADGYLAFWSWK